MALIKSKTLDNGESGNYWKAYKVSVDKETMKLNGALNLFKDSTYATNGNLRPLTQTPKVLVFPIAPSDITGDIYEIFYTKVKIRANTVVSPAVAYQAPQEAVLDGDNNIITPAVPEILAKAARYGDEDLHGAIDG